MGVTLCSDAGVTVIGEVNAMTSHLMNVLWLVGTFTFATVIGIITEDVTSTIMVSPSTYRAPASSVRAIISQSLLRQYIGMLVFTVTLKSWTSAGSWSFAEILDTVRRAWARG